MPYKVTRQEAVDAALSFRGVRFRHQGRDVETGVDCVGFLKVWLQKLKYPVIVDVEAYHTTPPYQVIYETLCENFDQIELDDVGLGDIYQLRVGLGRKPRHAAIVVNTVRDVPAGIEPEIIHAYGTGDTGKVVVDALEGWRPWCVHGFRLKGLVD